MMLKKAVRWFLIIMGSIVGLLLLLLLIIRLSINIPVPEVSNTEMLNQNPNIIAENVCQLGNNWIRKNSYDLWEMYVEGDGEERGIIIGKLSKDLIRYQEEVFVQEIQKYISSDAYLGFLRVLVAYFNRNIYKHIPEEYIKEIHAISLSASSEYNIYGPPFLRILNYHAAHDIGHALQNYALIGCTSFALWGEYTTNGSIYAGRNFDFYFGNAFAKEKIVEFVKPTKGYPFAFITWGGMIGAVSGLNIEGLSVTINAAKSDIPTSSAAPVSLVAREILQYASDIEGAWNIAKKRKMFVAESFLVTSAKDGRAIIIEKSPAKIDSFAVKSGKLLCTNHFQSKSFENDSKNLQNRYENATGYRFERLQELVSITNKFNEDSIACILRDLKGLKNQAIGMGNEKAINQMISHHSVIFNPEEKIMWVSTPPDVFQDYIAYDLDIIFDSLAKYPRHTMYIPELTIKGSDFIKTAGYNNYYKYKKLDLQIRQSIKKKKKVSEDKLLNVINYNPDYYKAYSLVGDYYYSQHEFEKAIDLYNKALKKEINAVPVKKQIESKIQTCKKKH